MSRSREVRDRYGTSSRTPSSPAAYIDSRRPPEFHGSTAPCSIVLPGSGTRAAMSTSDRTPRPWHAGHAPYELKAKDSALGRLETRAAHRADDLHALCGDRGPDAVAVRAQVRAQPRHHQ